MRKLSKIRVVKDLPEHLANSPFARWFLHHLFQSIYCKKSDDGYVQMSARYLQKQSEDYRTIIDELAATGLVEESKQAKIGQRCNAFKIKEDSIIKFVSEDAMPSDIEMAARFDRNFSKNENVGVVDKHAAQQANLLRKVQLNNEAVAAALSELPTSKQIHNQRILANIADGNIDVFTDRKSHRTFSPFSQLTKSIRKEATLDNEALYSRDITKCHPTLLVGMIMADSSIPKVRKNYLYNEFIIEDIYEHLRVMLGMHFKREFSRAETKTAFFHALYSNFNTKAKVASAIIRYVKHTYPEIYNIAKKLSQKQSQQVSLSWQMMRRESAIARHVVEICNQHGVEVLTVHDEFYVKESNREILDKVVDAVLEKYLGKKNAITNVLKTLGKVIRDKSSLYLSIVTQGMALRDFMMLGKGKAVKESTFDMFFMPIPIRC